MLARLNTAAPTFHQLLTGHFVESRGYATWRERGTDDWLLIATLQGRGRFGYVDGECFAEQGEVVLLSPGTRHDYGVEATREAWDLLWVHFHPRVHWMEWMEWPPVSPGLMKLSIEDDGIRKRILLRLWDVHRLAIGPDRRREALAMNALEEAILWCDAECPRSQQPRMDDRIREVVEFLCFNLSEKMDLSRLAGMCGLSVSRMAHLFRDQVGVSPQQYLELQRLTRAKQYLELTSRSIKAIAYDVGFEDPYYFTLRFKRHTGLSPRDYRRRSGAPGE